MSVTVFSTTRNGYTFNYPKIIFGGFTLVKDTDGTNVMHITYPKGSCAANDVCKGGCGFYGYPIYNSLPIFPVKCISLGYKVYFDPNFDFVKGGKLPGIYGGDIGANGSNHIESGFSVRYMWRANGIGEIYAYLPSSQDESYYTLSKDRTTYGSSIGYGSFVLKKGAWNKLKMHLKMNTPGLFDGVLKVWFNDTVCISFDKLNFCNDGSQIFNGIFFNTFFGGSTMDSASTLNTFAKFKDFQLTI